MCLFFQISTLIAIDGSNQLKSILEFGSASVGFKDNPGGTDYTYYPDGALKSDANKGISIIIYNYLGLIERVEFGFSKRIENIYDATGLKLSQTLINNGNTETTEYVGDLIYKNGVLETISHDEGLIRFFAASVPRYQFFMTDHLGNTRVIIERLNNSTALVQETHYGPWGEVLEGVGQPGAWDFLYQGKQFVSFNGYNLYDFETRGFDSYSGRFWQLDGANQFASGYTGMGNNPVSQIDPDGQIVPFVIAGAAIVGGAANVWGNWSKVKNWKQGLAYFGSGAAGGVATVLSGGNAALGGAITSTANVGIDLATGNLPELKSFKDVAAHTVQQAAIGAAFGYAGGKLGEFVGKGLSSLSTWFQTPYLAQSIGSETVKGTLYIWTVEVGVKATKSTILTSAVGSVGKAASNLVDDAANVGVQYSDDLLKSAQKLYPNKAGKIELHHPEPKYLGGAKNQALVPLDGAYHQQITNEFRRLYGYGQGVIKDPAARQKILDQVYNVFPLPK